MRFIVSNSDSDKNKALPALRINLNCEQDIEKDKCITQRVLCLHSE